MTKPRLIFVIGPTNAGKGTLLDAVKAQSPDEVGLVEVGKLMRAKYLDPKSPHYDPDHFKGQAAPTHTAKEAWQMMVDGINGAVASRYRVVLIDGQPRDVEQCEMIIRDYEATDRFEVEYAHVYAPESLRRTRAAARDAGDPAKLALSEARMQGDLIKIYEVLTRLINRGSVVHTIFNDGTTPMATFAEMLFDYELQFDQPIRSERLWRAPA